MGVIADARPPSEIVALTQAGQCFAGVIRTPRETAAATVNQSANRFSSVTASLGWAVMKSHEDEWFFHHLSMTCFD